MPHFDWQPCLANTYSLFHTVLYQGVITCIGAIPRAAIGITMGLPGHRGFVFVVTGSLRLFQMVTDTMYDKVEE